MKESEIRIAYREYELHELDGHDRLLVEKAKAATRGSHAPYSHFHVGAAILLADGTVVTGANQENAAYPSGTCAERTAAFAAGATHPGVAMEKIAIAARTECEDWEEGFQAEPISPCGACRQALLEYEHLHGPIEVILFGRNRTLVFPSVSSLLPFSFTEF